MLTIKKAANEASIHAFPPSCTWSKWKENQMREEEENDRNLRYELIPINEMPRKYSNSCRMSLVACVISFAHIFVLDCRIFSACNGIRTNWEFVFPLCVPKRRLCVFWQCCCHTKHTKRNNSEITLVNLRSFLFISSVFTSPISWTEKLFAGDWVLLSLSFQHLI